MANYTRFQLRGDTKANWLSANPVLADREPALETDTNRYKIGDGVSTYSQLSYGRNTGEYASLYNVTSLFPLPSGFYEHSTAILAIPSGERILGLIITYETASGVWYTERFIGTDIANWVTLSNWEKLPDAGDLAQFRSDLNELSRNACTNFIVNNYGLASFISSTSLTFKDSFKIFSINGYTPYTTILPQTITVPDSYGVVVAVYDKTTNLILPELTSFSINSIPIIDDSKMYIPILAYTYANANNIIDLNERGRCNILNYQPNWTDYGGTLAVYNFYGIYLPIKSHVAGIYVKVMSTDTNIVLYTFDLKKNKYSILKTVQKESLSLGIMYIEFDAPLVIGENIQVMINGKIGYKASSDISYLCRTLFYNINTSTSVGISYNASRFAISYKLVDSYGLSNIIMQLPMHDNRNIKKISTIKNIRSYTSTLINVGHVGRYIPILTKVSSVTVNARALEPISVSSININTGDLTAIKTVTPVAVGVMDIVFDAAVTVDYDNQIVVNGKIGYLYSTDIIGGKSGLGLAYNYGGNGLLQINPISLVDFSVEYNFDEDISIDTFLTNCINNILQRDYNAVDKGGYDTITVDISDYNNNLRNLFLNITPSETKHYIILIHEGTYNVDEWFTTEEKAVDDNSFRGLELPNYVKLLGVGARDKIILQWINGTENNRGYISTLNTHEYHELENLTIIGQNIRYAVHDDLWNGLPRYLRVKNCDFIVTDCSRAWGAGHNGGYDGEFIDCKFSVYRNRGNMDSATYIEPFGLHDNQYNAGDSKVLLSNCRFYNAYTDHPCVNFGMSANDGVTYARIIGCKMNTNVFLGAGTGENEGIINCRVTGFGNIMGVTPAISGNAIESIDTLIDLI